MSEFKFEHAVTQAFRTFNSRASESSSLTLTELT